MDISMDLFLFKSGAETEIIITSCNALIVSAD